MMPGFQRVNQKETELKNIKDIVIAGDIGCTGFDDESKKVFGAILREKPDLFFIIGDLVYNGTKEEFSELIDFCNQRTNAKVFALCGNHDNPGYAECCGLSSYAIVLRKYVCIFLDNSNAHFHGDELIFLQDEMEKHSGKKFMIFFHVPPPLTFNSSVMNANEWRKLRTVLDKFKEKIICLICAHIHGFYEYTLDGYHIFITAGGGGKLIYDFPKTESKIYNALKISLKDDAPESVNLLSVNP